MSRVYIVRVSMGMRGANGFFGEGEDLLFLRVELVLGENPRQLMRHEKSRQSLVIVELNEWKDGTHEKLRVKS